MPTLINGFEAPLGADAEFIAGWERAHAFLAAKGAVSSSALHRALRADVTLRFVSVARVDSTEAWQDAVGCPGAALPFTAHPALYAVVDQDGEPEGAGGVILINPFEVPADEDERFLAGWERVRRLFAARQGYLGTRLHRSLGPADFRFVAIVRWSSPLMFARTLRQAEVGETVAAMPFRGHPALYLREPSPVAAGQRACDN